MKMHSLQENKVKIVLSDFRLHWFFKKGDINRFSYPIRLSENKLNFSPAMLFIYHLGKDTYTETVNNKRL